jgi:putative membrane protein
MMYGNYGTGMWGALLMVVFMIVGGLLLWGLIVAGVVTVAHYLRGPDRSRGTSEAGTSARQVLAERFAQGEIDEVEYTQRLHVLDTTGPRPHPADTTRQRR